jgi:predicted Zn-dependent protease
MLFLKEAIQDYSLLINSSSDNLTKVRSALRFRAASFLQIGDFESAEKDAELADSRTVPHRVARARELLQNAEKAPPETAKPILERLLKLSPRSPTFLLKRAEISWEENDYAGYIRFTKDIIEDFPNDSLFNYRSGIAGFCLEDFDSAKKYFLRSENGSIGLRAIDNVSQNCENGINFLEAALNDAELFCSVRSPIVQNISQRLILVSRELNNKFLLVNALNRVIEMDPFNLSLRWERGNLNMDLGNLNTALYDFNFVKTQDPNNTEAEEAYGRAFDAKKEAERPDYYAALEIESDATQSEIQTAYKKAARKWHPDRFIKKEEKDHAHEVMRLINTAYEVLGDVAKREAYDEGGDWEQIGMEDLLKKNPTRTPIPLENIDFNL